MGRNRKRGKQFDLKNSVTFKLVARTADDPLFCDPNAPQYILVEKKSKDVIPIEVENNAGPEMEALTKRAALPVGPQLDWDPDVIKAMDDDYIFDDPNNQIDDDFVSQAMAEGGATSIVPRSEHQNCARELRQLDSKFEKMFIHEYGDEEAIGALDGDEEFEEVDTEMDQNQQELLKSALEEFAEAKQERVGIEYVGNKEAIEFVRARFVAKHSAKGDESGDSEDSDSTEYEEVEVVDTGRKGDKERLDCESVLSSYSNTNYHPKVLQDTDRYGNVLLGRQKVRPNHIRFDPRTGMPLAPAANDPFSMRDPSNNLAKLDALGTGTVRTNATSRLSELSVRPKNETAEERRERKKELKDYRAQRRAEKKANKIAFTEEKVRMAKQSLNSVVQKKVAVL